LSIVDCVVILPTPVSLIPIDMNLSILEPAMNGLCSSGFETDNLPDLMNDVNWLLSNSLLGYTATEGGIEVRVELINFVGLYNDIDSFTAHLFMLQKQRSFVSLRES
jgi:hypothetical protein